MLLINLLLTFGIPIFMGIILYYAILAWPEMTKRQRWTVGPCVALLFVAYALLMYDLVQSAMGSL
jgi:hypothetical protein